MSAKDCLWKRFRETCQTPGTCIELEMRQTCIFCGWDAAKTWEECKDQTSEIVRAVEEALAEDEAKKKDDPPKTPFW